MMGGALAYRRLPSPLHAARASVGAAWICALIAAALITDNPLPLCAIALAAMTAGWAAGVGARLRGALGLAAFAVLPIVIVNVLVSRQGLTVFARLGSLGPFGQGDLTVEALVYGAVIALKVGDVILLCALASLTVDPDELLALCGRLSFRAALTVSLALRMVPLLAADAQRLAEAQRTRPDGGARGMRGRARLIAATVSGALDRALETAATLELRGFAAERPRIWRRGGLRSIRAGERPMRRPLSRHDIAFLCSGAAVPALVAAGLATGAFAYDAYPLLHITLSPATVAFCLAASAGVLAPFLDRRGVQC